MKNKTLTLVARWLLISLFGMSIFSCHHRYQSEKLNSLILAKLHHADEEAVSLKNQVTKLKSQINSPLQKKFEEKNILTLCDFESKAALKKVVFPNNFFSKFEEKFNLKNKSKKTTNQEQKQLILTENILEKIMAFPKSKIEKFELENEPDKSFGNTLDTAPLGTILLTISMREEQLQKLFNKIVNDPHLFIISLVNISNSNPKPPPHHSVYSKEKLVPILGNDAVTATLRIKLFDLAYNHDLSQCDWLSVKTQQPLFVSRHYATKNETLINPINLLEVLCPPIPNEWVVKNYLDYDNPSILFEDKDQTGFNNLEKWQGDNPTEEPGKFPSDPNDPTSHPLLWTKLRCHHCNIISESYSIYFLGQRSSNLFQIQPNTPLESKNNCGKTVFNKKIRQVFMGERIEGLPYKVVNYQKKQTNYKNTCYDSSELTVEHLDTKQQVALIKKTPYHRQPYLLTNVTSIKLENTIFEPPQAITLKMGDYFSLDYFLPNKGSPDMQTLIERENYQLIAISDTTLTIRKNSDYYKIPIITSEK